MQDTKIIPQKLAKTRQTFTNTSTKLSYWNLTENIQILNSPTFATYITRLHI